MTIESFKKYNNRNSHFKNPFKKFYHKCIKRRDPYSLEAVSDLLNKFKEQTHFIKGNSNKILMKIDMSKIDFIFLDGGHTYETVKNDLRYSFPVLLRFIAKSTESKKERLGTLPRIPGIPRILAKCRR